MPAAYLSSAPKIGLLLRIWTFPRKRSETASKIGHILYFFAKVKDETMGRLQLLQEKELRLAGCSRDCNKRSKAVLQAMGL